MIWSLCITVDTKWRRVTDKYIKELCAGQIEGIDDVNILPPILDSGTIYDYCYDPLTNKWKHWVDTDEQVNFVSSNEANVGSEIVITTIDTIRYSFIQQLFIQNNIRSLFVGPPSTSKTTCIMNILNYHLSSKEWLII